MCAKYTFSPLNYIPSPSNKYQWNWKSKLNVNPLFVHHLVKLLSLLSVQIEGQRYSPLSGNESNTNPLCGSGEVLKQWSFLANKLCLTGWLQKANCEFRSTPASEIAPGPLEPSPVWFPSRGSQKKKNQGSSIVQTSRKDNKGQEIWNEISESPLKLGDFVGFLT